MMRFHGILSCGTHGGPNAHDSGTWGGYDRPTCTTHNSHEGLHARTQTSTTLATAYLLAPGILKEVRRDSYVFFREPCKHHISMKRTRPTDYVVAGLYAPCSIVLYASRFYVVYFIFAYCFIYFVAQLCRNGAVVPNHFRFDRPRAGNPRKLMRVHGRLWCGCSHYRSGVPPCERRGYDRACTA